MAVLGSMLIKPDVCDDLALLLRADDFYDDANAKLFSSMMTLHDAGRKIDVRLLVDQLKTAGDFELAKPGA